jgi:hypothetical protein
MTLMVVSALLAVLGLQAQESPKVPADSVLVDAPGCLKGRVFTGTPRPEDETTTRGADVTGRHFRLAGPREVMNLIKAHDGHLVQLVGIVRRAALDDRGIQRGRVGIGAPNVDPTRVNAATMTASADTMDVTSVRFLADRCP